MPRGSMVRMRMRLFTLWYVRPTVDARSRRRHAWPWRSGCPDTGPVSETGGTQWRSRLRTTRSSATRTPRRSLARMEASTGCAFRGSTRRRASQHCWAPTRTASGRWRRGLRYSARRGVTEDRRSSLRLTSKRPTARFASSTSCRSGPSLRGLSGSSKGFVALSPCARSSALDSTTARRARG